MNAISKDSLVTKINDEQTIIVNQAQDMIAHAITCGGYLVELRQLVWDEHGGRQIGWSTYCADHLVINRMQASKYMKLFNNQKKIVHSSVQLSSINEAVSSLSPKKKAVKKPRKPSDAEKVKAVPKVKLMHEIDDVESKADLVELALYILHALDQSDVSKILKTLLKEHNQVSNSATRTITVNTGVK